MGRRVTRGWPALALLGALTLTGSRAAVQADRRPDIALLLTDQQSSDALGIAGTPGLRTPAMDALAREGVRFTRAFCATPQCSPSRVALLTGRYPHRTGVVGNVDGREAPRLSAGMSPPLDPGLPNLGAVFRAAGYETAYFGKWHLGGDPSRYGWEVTASTDAGPAVKQGDPSVTARVLDFLQKRRDPRPLLLVVSWLNPHEIYDVEHAPTDPSAEAKVRLPDSLNDDLATKPFPQAHYLREDQGKPFRAYTPEQWRRYRAYYYRLVEQADAQVGSVVRTLRAGSPQSLVVFSSDHGDLQGAHGLPYKGPAMYEQLVRVPLIFSSPGRFRPAVQDPLVSNTDLLPTFCELAGIQTPAGVDGRSLRPLLEPSHGRPARRDVVFSEYYGKQQWRVPIRMVRTADWKYVRALDYGEELYDLRADPGEVKNLTTDPRYAGKLRELSRRLDRWIEESADPFPTLTVTDRQGRVLPRAGTLSRQ